MNNAPKNSDDLEAMSAASSRKRPWTISLQMLLISTFGGLVFLAVATVLGFSVYSNFTNTLTLLNQRSITLLNSMEREIRSETDQAERSIEALAKAFGEGLFEIDNTRSVRLRLKFMLRATPVIEMIHVYNSAGVNTGVLRRQNGDLTYDPIPVKLNSILFSLGNYPEIKSALWGEPLVANGVLYHNVYMSLVRDGKVQGTVVASIGRRSMNRIIVNLGQANDTTAFVLNAKDEVIAHSKLPEFFNNTPKAPLKNFPDQALRNITNATEYNESREQNKPVTILNSGDRRDGHIFLTKKLSGYASAPYTLGAYFDKYDALDEVQRIMISALVGLLALVTSIVAAILLSRRIAKPMHAISRVAGKFTRFEIDDIASLPPSRVREINEQVTAINSVRTAMSEFTHYVPKALVSKLVQTGTEASRSIEREVTIMFSDIVGFTRLSEQLDATETANVLNEHFELVCTEIDTCEGTVDKFMGDSVMAYWGAFDVDEDHADHAFQAATNIAMALKKDNEIRTREGKEKLQLRIGIHTGHVVVGNIGGGDRQNYTIIGDAVNVTQRLEQMGKEFIGDDEIIVLASATAKALASHRFEFENMGTKSLRGREMPISMFAFIPEVG